MRAFNVYNRFNKRIDTVYYADNFNSAEVQASIESKGDYNGQEIVVRLAKGARGKNITSVLRTAKQVLFTDGEYFNRDITGVASLDDVKDMFQIKGVLKKVGHSGNDYRYQLVDSTYSFVLRVL